MELHKRRKAITEPETRYFMHQVLASFIDMQPLFQSNLFRSGRLDLLKPTFTFKLQIPFTIIFIKIFYILISLSGQTFLAYV